MKATEGLLLIHESHRTIAVDNIRKLPKETVPFPQSLMQLLPECICKDSFHSVLGGAKGPCLPLMSFIVTRFLVSMVSDIYHST